MRRLLVLGALGLLVMVTLGLSSWEHRWHGQTMGTSYMVHFFSPGFLSGDQVSIPEIEQAVEQRLLHLSNSLSTYIQTSEISRFNQLPVSDACIPVSHDFWQVLSLSRPIFEYSHGAYDPTVGPLVEVWGFGSRQVVNWAPPSQAQVELALGLIGFDSLQTRADEQCVIKTKPVVLDFSALAKGYGVDQVAELLRSHGLHHFLVEIGGEIYVAGEKLAKRPWLSASPWQIRVEQPVGSESAVALNALDFQLRDTAVATSGDYRNFYEYQGRLYSHLIDPANGYPVIVSKDQARIRSVSVLSSNTATADGWATALIIRGLGQAQQTALDMGLGVVILYEREGILERWVSPVFNQVVGVEL